MPTTEDIRAVAPALEKYAKDVVRGDLWKRPGLSRARPEHRHGRRAHRARSDGRTAVLSQPRARQRREAGRTVGNHHALGVLHRLGKRDGCRRCGQGRVQEPQHRRRPASAGLRSQLPLDEAAEAQRATRVGEQFGKITPSLVQYTTDVLFRDLWLRPGLAPRDRSLVTVSALVATGQVAQITYHLNRAMDNGLTKEEAGEVVGHLAFYAGWPNAFSAAPVLKEVIEKRPR